MRVMAKYKTELSNFRTPLMLQIPVYKTSYGTTTKTGYEDSITFLASFKAKGTEVEKDGLLVIQETANVMCWYNPLIQSNARIKNLNSGKVYEILGDVENIDELNQRMQFKVRLIRGGI